MLQRPIVIGTSEMIKPQVQLSARGFFFVYLKWLWLEVNPDP